MINVFCGPDCNSETGFRQGSVISQTLFNILSCDMLEGGEEEPLQVGRSRNGMGNYGRMISRDRSSLSDCSYGA